MKFTTTEIDEFIQGKLPKEKHDMFVKAMQNDSEFAKEVEFYKKINASVKNIGREELRAELDIIHENKIHNKDQNSGITFKKILPWILAAVFIISFIGYLSLHKTQISDSGPALYATYYKPYEFNAGTRTSATQKDLLKLDELFALQKYESVIPLMEKYLSANDDNNVELALANAYLETGDTKQALLTLKALEAKNDVFLNGHVLWYKAMALLKIEDLESCSKALQEILKTPGSDHYNEAEALLEEMKD